MSKSHHEGEYVKVIVEQGRANFEERINGLYPEYRLKQVIIEGSETNYLIAILEHQMYHDG